MSAAIRGFVEWLLDILGRLPSTNGRIFASLCAFAAIITVWLGIAILHSFWPVTIALWEPSVSMLGFVTVWGGLDVAQFRIKRKTQGKYAPPESEDKA